LLVLSGLGLSACGGEEIECGEGTVEMDGTCVPESMLMCGEGTTMDAMGNCVPDGSNCAEGTTFDSATGECEPDLADCADGTVAMGDECVPDGSVICTGNTTYDEETGTCVVTEDACAEGTTLIDGECVPNDDTLMGEVFAAAEPDDPNFDGTPGDFLPPAIDEQRTIEGCITPDDFDMDDTTDVDIDYFDFSVADPGLFRINADGLGGLAAGFAVLPLDGPLADQSWFRVGVNLVGDTSERRVYLPRGGNYRLLVFDSRSLSLDQLREGVVTFPNAVGSEETCYFVTVEAEPIPTPTPIADGMADGSYGDPEFYSVTATGRTFYQAFLEAETGNGVLGGAVLSSAAGITNMFDFGITPVTEDGEDLLVVVSPVFDISLDRVDYDLEVSEIQQIPEDGDVTISHDDSLYINLVFEAEAGQVVHLTLDSGDAPLEVRSFSSLPPTADSIVEHCVGCTTTDIWYVVEQSGTQVFQVFNTSDISAGDDYTVTWTRQVQTPPVVSAGSTADVAFTDSRMFVRVDASSNVWSRFEVSNLMGTISEVDVGLWPDEPGVLSGFSPDGEGGVTDAFGRIHGTELGAPLLVELTDPAVYDGDEQVTFGFDSETFFDVTVDPSTPVTRTGDTIPAEAVTYYFVRGTPFGELTFEATGAAGVDVVIEELNPSVDTVETVDAGAAGESETFQERIPARGWFAFAVSAGASGGTVDVDVSQTEPPYNVTPGTSSFATVCPDGGGSGTVLVPNDFNVVSDPTPLSLSSFNFFSTPVTDFRASSDGYITFDPASSDPASIFGFDLGSSTTPNGVIAPLGRLLLAEVCVLQDSTRAVVEWNGQALGVDSDFNPFLYGTVEMQVILLGDGSIEFVYGPAHDVLATPVPGDLVDEAAVGLENLDSSIGISAGLPVEGGTSILFTPTGT
jgi:hypothetical protein